MCARSAGPATASHGRASNDPWAVDGISERAASLVGGARPSCRAPARARGRCARRVLHVHRDRRARAARRRRAPVGGARAAGARGRDPAARWGGPTSSARPTGLSCLPQECPAGRRRSFSTGRSSGPTAGLWPESGVGYWRSPSSPEGRAAVRNTRTGMALELAWDADWLRHMWIWHDVRTYGGAWRGQAEILVVERPPFRTASGSPRRSNTIRRAGSSEESPWATGCPRALSCA